MLALILILVALVDFLQLWATVVNQAPIVIAAADEFEDPPAFPVLKKLNSVWKLKLPWAARRHAKEKHRITSQETPLAQFIKISGPALKRSDLIDVRQVAQEAIAIHLNIGAGLHQHCRAGVSPMSSFARKGTQSRLSIRPTGRWLRRLSVAARLRAG